MRQCILGPVDADGAGAGGFFGATVGGRNGGGATRFTLPDGAAVAVGPFSIGAGSSLGSGGAGGNVAAGFCVLSGELARTTSATTPSTTSATSPNSNVARFADEARGGDGGAGTITAGTVNCANASLGSTMRFVVSSSSSLSFS